jgi:hypothetical protein
MRRLWLTALGLATLATMSTAHVASAGDLTPMGRMAWRRSMAYPWHGGYYHAAWGTPVALVVPPTAEVQTDWGWGVSNARMTTIRHQFALPYPGPYPGGEGFRATPPWPSDTRQFGVYYVRGPW